MSFNEILYRILMEAAIPGVGSILSFIPTIALMIFIFTLLRESGIIRGTPAHYLIGFSCSVPAILSCRSMPDKKQQIITSLLIPYISCSAKLPVYFLICSVFFPVYPIAVISSIYLIGILIIFVINSLHILPSGQPFMQRAGDPKCPGGNFFKRLKRPSIRVVFDAVKDVCLSFIKKAFTIILFGSMVIWLLQNLDYSFSFTSNIDDSLLAQVGDFIAPLFEPLGFGDRRACAALLSGLAAKEAAASTLAVLAGASGGSALCIMLMDIFTPASAFSFMIFYLLYAPCAATLGSIKTITGSWRYVFLALLGQTIFAWLMSLLAFKIAGLFL